MTINTNIYPYYSDQDDSKNFHQILFVPGRAVQARELTQMQTILQEQIARHGNHVFKNGTMVIPGHIFYDSDVIYVKLNKTYNGVQSDTFIEQLVGTEAVGGTSKVYAKVVHVAKSSGNDLPTLFIKYTKAGEGTGKSVFSTSEVLTFTEFPSISAQIESGTGYSGKAALATINEGVYFVNGYFVQVAKTTIIAAKYSNTPSCKIGLEIVEDIVTENEDSTLLDPAQGFSNFTAPGAHRLRIQLNLVSRDVDFEAPDTGNEIKFISLLQVRNGAIQYKNNDTAYVEMERVLARRTFDGAGNFIVDAFDLSVRNYRSNNRGTWATGTTYMKGDVVSYSISGKLYYFYARDTGVSGATQLSQTFGTQSDGAIFWTQTSKPSINDGSFPVGSDSLAVQQANDAKISTTITDGKAYISGFEVGKPGKTLVTIDKARESKFVNSSQVFAPSGTFVTLSSITGMPDISSFEKLNIINVSGSGVIGTCRVRNIVADGSQYKLYIFDIKMNSRADFSLEAKFFKDTATSGSDFTGTIKTEKYRVSGLINVAGATVSGIGSNFELDLKSGMTVYLNNSTSAEKKYVSSVNYDLEQFTISVAGTAAINITCDVEYIVVSQSDANIVRMPHEYIKSLRNSSGELALDTQYVIHRYYGTTGAKTAGTGENFLTLGHVGDVTVTDSTHITVNTGPAIVAVRKSNLAAKEKFKTLATKTVYLFDDGIYATAAKSGLITSAYNSNSLRVELTEADIVRIVNISASGSSSQASYVAGGETDITKTASLWDGQTPEFYDIGEITFRSAPARCTRITFEYFDHSIGDYFSVDSYSSLPYEQIPIFKTGGASYNLRDCLDFRPRVSDDGSGFTGIGSVAGEVITAGDVITFDYSYYLPRVDKVVLTKGGEINVIKGVASDEPTPPKSPDEALDLYTVYLAPYTINASKDNIAFSKNDHRGYTMKDISALESRLSNVEEYMTLTLLEKQTADLSVVDKFGLDRFKNGFFVDQFKDYEPSDTDAPDYRAVISQNERLIRPNFSSKENILIEREGTSPETRALANYRINKNLATLNYTESSCVMQTLATRGEFINPFAIFLFRGAMQLFPNNDHWTEYARPLDKTAGDLAKRRIGDRNAVLQQWWGLNEDWLGLMQLDRVISGVNISIATVNATLRKNAVELIRKKRVNIVSRGLKPFGILNGFIDKNPINEYLVPMPYSVVSLPSGKFLGYDDIEFQSDRLGVRSVKYQQSAIETPLLTPAIFEQILSNGEIIEFKNIGGSVVGTAVCVGYDYVKLNSADVYKLTYDNLKGTTSGAISVVGSQSGATATISSNVIPTQLVTDSLGNFYGTFTIPHKVFKTGRSKVELMDRTDGDAENALTRSVAEYVSVGDLSTTFLKEVVTGFKTFDTWVDTGVRQERSRDPLAQTFSLPADAEDGAFITSVGVYFHTKDAKLPATIQICETQNGYPAQITLRNGEVVLYPEDITASEKVMIQTRAYFPAPVYLRAGVEYCLKILTDSTTAKVWISRMGERRVDEKNLVVTEQPHLGSLFKSQNNSSWVAEQQEDLAFVIYRAKFDTSRSGVINMQNFRTIEEYLPASPFGVKSGSALVRVDHPNHGFTNGMSVTLSGVVGSSPDINGTHVIHHARNHFYFITASGTFSTTDFIGGENCIATCNVRMDVHSIDIQAQALNKTFFSVAESGVKVTTNSVTTSTATIEPSFTTIFPNTLVNRDVPLYLLSDANRTSSISGAASLELKILIGSTSDWVSPMVVMDSAQLSSRTNDIELETVANNYDTTFDDEVIVTGSVVFEADDDSLIVTTGINRFQVGAYITVVGASQVGLTKKKILNVDVASNKVFVDHAVVDATAVPTSVTQHGAFISEESIDAGTAGGKYISKIVRLDSQSSSLKVMFAVNVPTSSEIEVWYRAGNSVDDDIWTKIQFEYRKSANQNEFIDYDVAVDNIASFTQFQVKLIMRSSNPSTVPRFKDLRVIALA
jgi:hypothetical protein